MKIALSNGAWTKKGEVIEIDSVATAERLIESIQDACVAASQEQIDHSEDIMRFRPLLNAERGVEREPVDWNKIGYCNTHQAPLLADYPGCYVCRDGEQNVKPINFCGKCGHRTSDHPEVRLADGVNECVNCRCPRIQSECGQPNDWDAKPDTSPEASLSLLVIDLGESCVVKVETSDHRIQLDVGSPDVSVVNLLTTHLVHHPFTEVRAAIDALDTPSIPRIERDGHGGYQFYYGHTSTMDQNFTKACYDALTALNNGVPLPIYSPKIGTWTQIGKHWRDCPVELWRYRK